MIQPLRIAFMGTPEFAVPSLRALAKASDIATVVAVFTQPDRPSGRGLKLTKPPVKIVAEELGLPIYQPENINEPDQKRFLADLMVDAVVVVAYAQFLSKAILNTPRLGCINVHSSLLPKFRGAAPIQYAIWKGEKETGVTTMRLVPKMDAGPVLLQKKLKIDDRITSVELAAELAELGGQAITETLELLRDSKLSEKEQDHAKATYAHLIKKEDGLIDWNKSGQEILLQIRALHPWPGTFTKSTRGTLKILTANFHPSIQGAPHEATPGDPHILAGTFLIRCADGWIQPLNVQPEGKRAMSIQEFLNGIKNNIEIGKILS